jgi:hypothetical protein
MSDLDVLLIDGYLGGINAPSTEQAGFETRVDQNGTNLEYVALLQTLAGSGAWDGSARVLLVNGSGPRSISLPDADIAGRELTVKDAIGNSASGTITLDPVSAGTIDGSSTKTITTNFGKQRLVWVSAGVWLTL